MPPRTDAAPTIGSVGVFCSSIDGLPEKFRAVAAEMGAGLGRRRLKLVYGGSQVGLMGIAARAALAEGGEVIGVLPERLLRGEAAERAITELILVDTLGARKTLMNQFADCFVALPGGLGTLDEVVTELLNVDLGNGAKPIFLVDVDGYWRGLADLIAHFDRHGMLRPRARTGLTLVPSVAAFFAALGRAEA
jgi:hypothetical protein